MSTTRRRSAGRNDADVFPSGEVKATSSPGAIAGTVTSTGSKNSPSRSSTKKTGGRGTSPSKRRVTTATESVARSPCVDRENCSQAERSEALGTHQSTNGSLMGDANAAQPFNAASNAVHSRTRDVDKPHSVFAVWFMKTCGCLLVLFFFIIPAFIKLYPAIIADVAFLNRLRWPPFIDLSRPDELGLNLTRNFMLPTTDSVTVGAWHVLPQELVIKHAATGLSLQYDELLKSGHPIIVYLHGNAGTRAGWHRVQLYKLLANNGFHVLTFDYRGYGDSNGYPSEDGLIEDAVSVFKWLKRQVGDDLPVYIWGHSLGSAVATKTASQLCHEGIHFEGLILESPFNNFVEAASNHPFSTPFRVMPWFSWVFIDAIKINGIRFASDENIKGVTVPVVILHALDDGIVPYELGQKLYERARTHSVEVQFVTFDGDHGYGHKHIHKSPDLIPTVRKFMTKCSLAKTEAQAEL